MFSEIYNDIQKFNQHNPDSSRNIIKSDKVYRGNQHDLDTFNNTIQYMEYKKNLRKNKLSVKVKKVETYDNYDSIQNAIEIAQYKKNWSKLDVYCKKVKISEYIEKMVSQGEIEQRIMKECIAHLYRLLEQKKLNKKGNIEYDADAAEITSISDKVLSLECF